MSTATFGKLTDGGAQTAASIEAKVVGSAAPTYNGTIISLTARVWVTAGTAGAKPVVYTDNGGVPDALLTTGDETIITQIAEAPMEFVFGALNEIDIVSGTTYHFGLLINDPGAPQWVVSRGTDANLLIYNADAYADGPANPFGVLNYLPGPPDFYVTYQLAGKRRRRLMALAG